MGNGIHRAHKNKHNPLSTNLTRKTSSIGNEKYPRICVHIRTIICQNNYVYLIHLFYYSSLIGKCEGSDTQNSTIRQEGEEVEARDAENHVAAEQVTIKQNAAKGPPEFNLEHKLLIVESWHYVQDHFSEVVN